MPLDPLEITGGLAIGEGLGGAIEDTVKPRLQSFKNSQWAKHPDVPLAPGEAAEVAAENYDSYVDMALEASFSGYDAARFLHLYDVTVTAPGLGTLIELYRRRAEVAMDFEHGLRKAKLEPAWDAALQNLASARLSPQEIALGIVRSTINDPGLLVVTLDTDGSTIPKYPAFPGDALAEAATSGINRDRLRAMVGAVGLPMSPQQSASATFRKIINRQAFNLSILEGDIRPEYADAIFEQARQILTAGEYAELELRGYYDRATRLARTAQHGMSERDSDDLFDVLGRGVNVHQVLIGERRGGTFNGPTDAIPPAYLFALQRGNLRPEVYNLAYAARETYPSYFVTRALLQAGVITAERGQQLFDGLGWPDDVAKAAGTFFAGGSTSTADPHVSKAENQLWTALHSSYVKDRTDDPTATSTLAKLGVAAGSIPSVLSLWQAERDLVRGGLSPAAIKKAYFEATFTKDEATARLVEIGWSAADAGVYLGE